jgi:hypothetical protein
MYACYLRSAQAGPCYNKKVIVAWQEGASTCHMMFFHQSCPSWIPRWLQRECRENGSEQRAQIQNGNKLISCF